MKCPDCAKVLIDVATACRCGWKLVANLDDKPKPDKPKCGCGEDAILSVIVDDGRANVCETCYVGHFTALALENMGKKTA